MISWNSGRVEVKCDFGSTPTLAMFIEAAAQCSAAFDLENTGKMGFLTMARDVKFLEKIEEKEYRMKLKKEAEIHPYKQFSFEAYTYATSIKVVSGYFTLIIDG